MDRLLKTMFTFLIVTCCLLVASYVLTSQENNPLRARGFIKQPSPSVTSRWAHSKTAAHVVWTQPTPSNNSVFTEGKSRTILHDTASTSDWVYNKTAADEVRAAAARLSLYSLFRLSWLGHPPQKRKCPSKRKTCRTRSIVGHQKTCALVGNSGILLGSDCGPEIDSKDFVVRMDLPDVLVFEKDVGGRTDMTVVSPETANRVEGSSKMMNRSEDVYEGRLRGIKDSILMTDVESRGRMKAAIRRYKLSFRLLSTKIRIIGIIKTQRSVNQIASAISGRSFRRKPTVGLFTSLMMTSFCDKLALYGFFPFQKDTNNRSIPYHYYQGDFVAPIIQNKGGHHNMAWEYNFHKELHKKGVYRMHVGPCTNKR
ncbi:ST8SIA4 [Branchiostoma lanceolatum]|uniref:ST8SIA4 protein n=2 Tax=Branchiostoma lanceolatum TaxID=7740 RepID=A0A8J9W6G6_BRALA|nr:ST8SIA4 [Branchiostoma lanceolatum]